MSPPRILVVDDEPSIRMVLKMALEDSPYDVAVAESAEAALDLLASRPFDLLLVDKNLPGMSGVDLIRKVREQSKVPAVLMTAFGSAESATELLNLGIAAYIEKPFKKIWAVPELVKNILSKETVGWTPAAMMTVSVAATTPGESSRALRIVIATTDERLATALAIPPPAQVQVFAALEDVLRSVAREEIDLIVIDVASFTGGAVAIVKEVISVAPFITCALVCTGTPLSETKVLIELGVTCMVDRELEHGTTQKRIRGLVEVLLRAQRD